MQSLAINSNNVKSNIKKVRTIMNTNFFASVVSELKEFFIWIHESGFEVIGWSIEDYRHGDIIDVVLDIILGILGILCALLIDFLVIYGTYILFRRILIILKTKEIKHYNVIGIIKSKEHQVSYVSHMYTGKVLIPIYHEEEYNVYVEYDEVEEVFNNEKIFKKYEEEDQISLILIEKLDKNNDIIERTLELPK